KQYLALRLHSRREAPSWLDSPIIGIESQKGGIQIDLASGRDGTFGGSASGPSPCRFCSEVSQLGRPGSGSGAQDTSLLPDRLAGHWPDTARGDDTRSHNHGRGGLFSTSGFPFLRQSSAPHFT